MKRMIVLLLWLCLLPCFALSETLSLEEMLAAEEAAQLSEQMPADQTTVPSANPAREDFIDRIINDKPIATTAQEGAATVAAALAAIRSAASGKPEAIDYNFD